MSFLPTSSTGPYINKPPPCQYRALKFFALYRPPHEYIPSRHLQSGCCTNKASSLIFSLFGYIYSQFCVLVCWSDLRLHYIVYHSLRQIWREMPVFMTLHKYSQLYMKIIWHMLRGFALISQHHGFMPSSSSPCTGLTVTPLVTACVTHLLCYTILFKCDVDFSE